MKKSGEVFNAKIKAIGPEDYIEECLRQLSMVCHNLLPHQEPDIIFPTQLQAMMGPNSTINNCEAPIADKSFNAQTLVSASSQNAAAYENSGNSPCFSEEGQQNGNFVELNPPVFVREQQRKRKVLLHPNDIELQPPKSVKINENLIDEVQNGPSSSDLHSISVVSEYNFCVPEIFFANVAIV